MSNQARIFREFIDEGQANAVAALLEAAGIPFNLQKERRITDTVYVGPDYQPAVKIFLDAADFSKAQEVLEKYYATEAEKMSADYYLFGFTNAELLEVVVKADEWNMLDVQLAKKLLKERKAGVDEHTFSRLEEERKKVLAKKEDTPWFMLIGGYLMISGALYGCWTLFNGEFSLATAFIFSMVVAAFIGMHIRKSSRTLPDGTLDYSYSDDARQLGAVMYYGSLATLAIGFIALLLFLKESAG